MERRRDAFARQELTFSLSLMSFCSASDLLIFVFFCPFVHFLSFLPFSTNSHTNLSLFSVQLSELYSRSSIQSSSLISNPGCYATNNQSLLAPILPYLDFSNPPTVFGVSGYSGAGTKAGQKKQDSGPAPTVPKISAEDLKGGVKPYSLTDHIHERESSRHLSRSMGIVDEHQKLNLAFVPNIAPWFQGIISTVSAPLKENMTARNLKEIYQQFYEGEKLVKIKNEVPEVQVSIDAEFLSIRKE